MRRFRAPRAILSAFLAVGCASFSSFASAQTILTGRFRSHVLGLGSGQTFLTGKIVTPFDVSDPSFGRLAGAFTVDFPDFTPPGRLDDAGTSLVLASPMLTHASLEITWTTPTQKAGSPENIFSSQIAAETWRPDLEDFRHSHCGTPLSNGEVPIQPGLVANTPYHFQVSADCTWTSLPFSKVGFGGDAVIDSSMFFDAFGLSATGAGPNLSAVARFVISTYDFPSSDLSVDHIEIVQTVQRADNSAPVFVGKSTVVRVFPKLTDANPANTSLAGVTGVLRGPGGKELTPFNPGKAVTAKLSPDREATNDSLNFALPPDWTAEGDLSLTAVLNPGRTVPESNYDNNSRPLPEPKHFDKSSSLRIAYFPLCYLSLQNCPSNAIATYHAMAQKLYPLGDLDLKYLPLKIPRLVYPFTIESTAGELSVLAFLQLIFNLVEVVGAAPDQLVGWLPAIPGAIHQGLSDPIYDGGKSRVLYAQDLALFEKGAPPDLTLSAYIFAHEVAHNLGLRHTDLAEGGDGCGAIDAGSDFPQYYTDKKATIHEPGFDPVYRVAIPSSNKDLMTSCTPPNIIWISPYHWEKLGARLESPSVIANSGVAAASPQIKRAALASDYVLVSGQARSDGSAGRLDSILRISAVTGAPPSDPSGTHCLQFSSGATVLSRYCFTLSFDTQIRGTADTSASGLDTASFSVKAPFPAGATRIALLAGTAELASAAQSAHAPKISITSPANGAVWSGANTLAWTASDEDGDPLTFSILTSADEGASWVPLQAGLTASQYSFDTAELSAGNKTLFKVLASDGFNTTAATVGPLTILAQPFIEATPGLDFGTVATGQSSTLPILLTNRGELAVKVTALTFDNARFSTDAAVPFSIAPGGSQSVNVNFRPTSTGPKTARLTIVSDDTARSPLTVSLSGSGACVSIGGSPCSSPRTPRTLLPRS